VEVIESSLCHLKGKHNSTKARILMEAVAGGKFFNGEAVKAMSQKIRCYIKNLFQPWKLDVAAVSAFKSSTIMHGVQSLRRKKNYYFLQLVPSVA
jgi:hypothetical protein